MEEEIFFFDPAKTHNLNGDSQTRTVNIYYFYLLGVVLQNRSCISGGHYEGYIYIETFPPTPTTM